MDTLINIDNGGTLTDICLWDGDTFTFSKTLTTPVDLSQCLFDGLEKASAARWGEADLERLLHTAAHIRYSTTQGTNALVERKGPSLGLLVEDASLVDAMRSSDERKRLFDDIIGKNVEEFSPDAENLEFDIVQKTNKLTTNGAARVVVVGRTAQAEDSIKHILLQKFPRHLLGSVPLLYSWDFVGDRSHERRAWSCVLNSFLHPTMERFLYGTQHRLNDFKVTNPLLIYRNDGQSSRVSKAVALKTYSSGPRGGLEGTLALAQSYGLQHVLMMDVGGTTTDVGVIEDDRIVTNRRGDIAGVPTSFPMSEVHSFGIGGSSIIAVKDGAITVGPRSVGAAPGPACFGLGGKSATITDVNLLLGILDADTYLDSSFHLDINRARTAVEENVAKPLGISVEEALIQMEQAYFDAMADVIRPLVDANKDTVLAAFGGAGPMSACGAARRAGIRRVLIPRMAAVFSAFGISFSDIGKTYEIALPEATAEAAEQTRKAMLVRAERDMFQEGYSLDECQLRWSLTAEDDDGESVGSWDYQEGDDVSRHGHDYLILRLDVTKELAHPVMDDDREVTATSAEAQDKRTLQTSDGSQEVPVYQLDAQKPGAAADGPAIVEGPFFTSRVLDGWRMEVTTAGDLLLTDQLA